MSNGVGTDCAAPAKPNFFENTEGCYQQTTDRLAGFSNRIHNVCDRIGGPRPEKTSNVEKIGQESPDALFDRCNLAEQRLSNMVEQLDGAIGRLENIGLF